MSQHAQDALFPDTSAFSDLPTVPEYTNKALLSRVRQATGRTISTKTLRRWRSQTGLTDPYLTDRDVWILSVYGRYMAVYKRPNKAFDAAQEFINKVENCNYESA